MKILFLDTMGWKYDPTSPARQAMGGTQSGVIYLTAELAKLGHAVTVINGVDPPMTSKGVHYRSLPVSGDYLNDFDVMVVVANALGKAVRSGGYTKPMVMWCHHAPNQGAVKDLADPTERAAWQGYAMVSDWQAQTYVDYLGVPRAGMKILRNAISPYFYKLEPKQPWYQRGTSPVLAYSSAPFRGMDILLCAFPLIRARVPGTTLRIYSSMKIYGPGEDDEYIALYELARNLPGVEYVGPLPQGQLAEALRDVDIWSYPSTFAETSCIACMEAMAAGNMVITTHFGALPETTNGHAILVDRETKNSGQLITRYALAVADAILKVDPAVALEKRARQMQYAQSQFTWENRAREWEQWLTEIAGRRVS